MNKKVAARSNRGKYPGGKNGEGVYQRIINIIPPHDTLIEACAGSAAITRMIKPAKYNIVIEAEPMQAAILHKELRSGVGIFNDSFYRIIKQKSPNSEKRVIFFDPPYIKEVRSCSQNMYRVEWDYEDHTIFLEWLQKLEGKAIITHPRNLLYENRLQGWNTIDYQYQSHGGIRNDCIWYNYPTPEVLHDYSNIGDNRTKRQVIQRRMQRYINKLDAMSQIERNALIEAIKKRYNRPE